MNDDDLDALLRADAGAGPADAGFTLRLMRRLPPRPVRISRQARRITQLAALSLAVLALGLLWPDLQAAWSQGRGGEAGCTAAALLLLIVGWTLPQGRLNPWA